jgi:multidrug efflux pump subunit AcrB
MKGISYFLDNRIVTLVATVLLIGLGIQAFTTMPRLEDPEFTIKDALVITSYPGASAEEVELEVTDEIEQAVQQLGQLDSVSSRSEQGLSTVTVSIRDSYGKETLPQVWDELRRKIGDAERNLPPGAGRPLVMDDYGDVYGIFLVIYGEEYTYAELQEVVDFLKREILLVEDVAKVETLGTQTEAVHVELNRERLAQLAIPPAAIVGQLQARNLVHDSGRVPVGREYLALNPTSEIQDLKDFEMIRVSANGHQLFLRDIAEIRRGYLEPPRDRVRFNGHPGIALGISTRSGGNVITMGEALEERMTELIENIPLGIDFGVVSMQSTAVNEAVNSFLLSLLQAVGIVILVLLLFMGLRSGLLIGFILLVTILGTFIFLKPMGVALERVSLGALIIALGMLVDNAIVIVDGMLVRISKGRPPREAALDVVRKTGIPLLGATAIAILAFAAIGTSNDSTGEFCRSLFQVVFVSLSLSWVTAVTITPLLGILVLKPAKGSEGAEDYDPYDTPFYRVYRSLLAGAIRYRWLTLGLTLVLFAISVFGFTFIKSAFFPPSTRPQFMVDLWMPQGTHIDETTRRAVEFEELLREEEGVGNVSTFVGRGALRFLLTYGAERPNTAYAHFLVDVEDAALIDRLIRKVDTDLNRKVPGAEVYGYKFELGPGSKGKVEARFLGRDANVLRDLESQALSVFKDHPRTKAIRTDWRQRVKVLRPEVLEDQANLLGITTGDIAEVLRQGFSGLNVGVYREADKLLPIVLRLPESLRGDVANLENLQVWSPVAGRSVPLSQVVSGLRVEFRDEIIQREDRKRKLSVYADPVGMTAAGLLEELRPRIEAIPLPDGYTLEWGGEYENSSEAQAALAATVPLFIGAMIVLTIVLFNSLRQPLVIWLCVPLILIGVTFGLLIFDKPFNFMAILGFLSLVGMMIKNAIVLLEEVNERRADGQEPWTGLLDAGTSRLRPVAMATATTALGMLPLFADAFFVAMAITIIFGLVVGSVLTMIILPVIYSVFYGIRTPRHDS